MLYRDWRDPSWVDVVTIQSGLAQSTRRQRSLLFGNNVIDIQLKSTISLLVDEVFLSLSR